jgi:hypothetical protein
MPTAAPALRLDSQQISAITEWANDPMSTVASIVDALEALQFIDPKCDLVRKSREEELSKLEGFSTFVPRLKDELIGSGCIVRNGVWVDKAKPEGIKSRFTCADIKPKGAKGDHNTFMPTPHSVSHKILELKALKNNWCVKTADIVSAFLIAEDPGDENGQPVFIRAPSEYQPFLEKWIGNLTRPEDTRSCGATRHTEMLRCKYREIYMGGAQPEQHSEIALKRCSRMHQGLNSAGAQETLLSTFVRGLVRHCSTMLTTLDAVHQSRTQQGCGTI